MNTARIVVLTIAARCRRRCRISCERVRQQAGAGRAGRATADRRRSRRQVRHRPWPVGQARGSAVADLAGRDRQQHLHPPQRTPGCDHPDRRLDRARALHRRRADPRAEAGQGRRLRLHGGDPAHRHARHLDRNLAGDRRRRLHPAERPGRRHSFQAREECRPPGSPDIVNSEIILTNVRVLAIDQAPKEKDGQNAVVGKTVTLELKPEQAETLARARQTGTLALALRSIADVNMVENRTDDQAPSAAIASTWFATASQARRRHRSDRKDAAI